MATRNVKSATVGLFDPAENLQSTNTLKRHPNPDWSKSDLLRLLSYFEGELQARDITIAALRAEKSKQLYYQAKYGRFGLGDPFMALQRDSDNTKDNIFDESAIKSMYDNQLAQLENLIATQRKAQLKMREQLANSEKRTQKICSELEDEKCKHAQDTAQGDDVTYMLEKERERLKQEIDFEKGQVKRLEKDLKKMLSSLEEERSNSVKHKEIAIMLIKERNQMLDKVSHHKHRSNERFPIDDQEIGNMEGTCEHKNIEVAIDKLPHDVEHEQLKSRLAYEESKNKDQFLSIGSLNKQIESLTIQLQSMLERSATRESIQSIEMKSSVTPHCIISNSPCSKPTPKNVKPVLDSRLIDQSAHAQSLVGKEVHGVNQHPTLLATQGNEVGSSAIVDRSIAENINVASGSNATVFLQPIRKISLHLGQSVGNTKKTIQGVRGTPPPLPPNKPVLSYGTKPTPPPKVGITISKDTIIVSEVDALHANSPKGVQIPVNVVREQSVPP
ncbi:CTTNBP2 N-terminal-like protein [Patella vulgata]|uniref:CTTNBP2 N-terminal-like protein n=1 Tax=Patella vulgata TaxID=6465 RepID=UPI00217F919E|nr:CTTNBP2 N-terminal-like protein [Patella vulgata]